MKYITGEAKWTSMSSGSRDYQVAGNKSKDQEAVVGGSNNPITMYNNVQTTEIIFASSGRSTAAILNKHRDVAHEFQVTVS